MIPELGKWKDSVILGSSRGWYWERSTILEFEAKVRCDWKLMPFQHGQSPTLGQMRLALEAVPIGISLCPSLRFRVGTSSSKMKRTGCKAKDTVLHSLGWEAMAFSRNTERFWVGELMQFSNISIESTEQWWVVDKLAWRLSQSSLILLHLHFIPTSCKLWVLIGHFSSLCWMDFKVEQVFFSLSHSSLRMYIPRILSCLEKSFCYLWKMNTFFSSFRNLWTFFYCLVALKFVMERSEARQILLFCKRLVLTGYLKNSFFKPLYFVN